MCRRSEPLSLPRASHRQGDASNVVRRACDLDVRKQTEHKRLDLQLGFSVSCSALIPPLQRAVLSCGRFFLSKMIASPLASNMCASDLCQTE